MARLGWLVVLLALLRPAAAAELALAVEPGWETVFDWSRDRCADDHAPDAPARAFRDADGAVHLLAVHDVGREMVGPSLDAVRVRCAVVFRGGGDSDPAAADDRVWLAAVHTGDGRTVHALGHAEYHGHRHPGACTAPDYRACWRNAVVALVSHDGGRSFARPPAPSVVAALPYPHDAAAGRPIGYFSPSNIVAHAGALHAFVYAEPYRDQRRGPCLLRTATPEDPTSWRAWDGAAFAAPLAPAARRGAETCAPVPGLAAPVTAVVRHAPSGLFVALFASRRSLPGRDGAVAALWYATSPDLLRWSPPALLLEVPLMFAFGCGDPAVYDYAALLDPESSSPSFETVGDAAWLYLARFRPRACRLTMERDLVRARVRLVAR